MVGGAHGVDALFADTESCQRAAQGFIFSVEETSCLRTGAEVGVPVVALEARFPFVLGDDFGEPAAPERRRRLAEPLRSDHAAPIALDHVETLLAPGRDRAMLAGQPRRRRHCD